jgi:hypothetical protein
MYTKFVLAKCDNDDESHFSKPHYDGTHRGKTRHKKYCLNRNRPFSSPKQTNKCSGKVKNSGLKNG